MTRRYHSTPYFAKNPLYVAVQLCYNDIVDMLSFPELRKKLIKLYKKKSLRQIALEDYEGTVTHAAVDRCIKGHEPKRNDIRKAFLLPLIFTQYKHPITGRYIKKGGE